MVGELEKQIIKSDYTIMVVDDVMSNVLLLKVLLSNEDYKVITANFGRQALELVRTLSPDLILLDVMMPDLSGFEVAQYLKSDPITADIPIIFLTALNSTQDIVKGFNVGASDFVSKPFNKEELLIRVMHQISLIAAKRIILKKTEELQNTILGRDKLYSVIAHDLRSPMSAVKMVLNLLAVSLSKELIGNEMSDMIVQANEQVEEIFSLLDNLLKWTKSQTGRLNVVRQKFIINESVMGMADIFNMVASSKKIKLVIKENSSDGKLEVYADIDMVKTILRNLISNAIKFSKEGTSIEIFYSHIDGYAVINVQDHGCGISKEDQTKLFNTKTHYSKYGTRNEEGSGLGLLLCKDFAEKNGGNLWLDSTEGVGSIFSFSVPLISTIQPS